MDTLGKLGEMSPTPSSAATGMNWHMRVDD